MKQGPGRWNLVMCVLYIDAHHRMYSWQREKAKTKDGTGQRANWRGQRKAGMFVFGRRSPTYNCTLRIQMVQMDGARRELFRSGWD